jgi:hypothetical protein
MPRRISPATSLDSLRKEAKRRLRALRSGDPDARAQFDGLHGARLRSGDSHPTLRDVQHALAGEYGYDGWQALKKAVTDGAGSALDAHAAGTVATDSPEAYEAVVQDLLLAFNERDDAALQRLNDRRGTSFSFDDLGALIWRGVYAFRQRASRVEHNTLLADEARTLVAQYAGYASWAALTAAPASRPARVPAFHIDAKGNRASPRRMMSDRDWDEMLETMKEQRITALEVGGQMTDERLAQVATLECVTSIALGGGRQLTDTGLRLLARMPQLEHLNLSSYPGGNLTDRGLEVLRDLPRLRRFEMTWQKGTTDAGLQHLAACERLESVDVMGTPTGDGVISALAGKPHLRELKTGRLVTDDGLAALREIPRFRLADRSSGERGPRLLIDGPFTDEGVAHLAALEGIVDLDLFWHVTGITSQAFAHLARLPNLQVLGADGPLSDDEAMRHIAAIPRLRRLRAQESVATDIGFEALSASKTLEGFWGRVCPNFGSRGFLAFARMPALRSLGVGCRNVEDRALAKLPDFPALRELTPIDVRDEGFGHIGRCARLERLICMYCRETTDAATTHITALPLTYYYAGLTLITDRSLELLGRMTTLEQIEFYECGGITDAGLPFLSRLPRLREVNVGSSPGVTFEGTKVFPPHVRVTYST